VGRDSRHHEAVRADLVPAAVPVAAERLVAKRIVAMADDDPAATAYKVLRTHVLQRMRANGWKTLAITSPTQGNGKTVTAINLAITLARDVKHTILLVDLDLRRPSLASYFFPHPLPGLSDYITEDRPIDELLIDPGIDRLTLLPGNHSFTHSSEILCSPKMIELVDELKGRHADRLVLFDMPPVLGGDDVIAFSPYVDAVLLVVEEGKTSKDELSEAYALLDGDKILGTVLNKAEEGSTGVGYY
jgi:capsular exopolysaccharide synthesis family protein